MKIAFLYAGQGSQYVGMGKDLYESNDTYRNVIDEVGKEYRDLMHEGPDTLLNQTRFTQPCMGVFAAGVTAALYENGIVPNAALGLSLGEYSALHAAGVFDAKTLVELLAFRGREMEQAGEGISYRMEAVLGLGREEVETVCAKIREEDLGYVVIANYNCPMQYVICGEDQAVSLAEEQLLHRGAKRCVPLNVSGPFHTKFMKLAGEALKEYFGKISFQAARIPVIHNVTGNYKNEKESIQELLIEQVQGSVRFEDSIQRLLDQEFDTFVEIGPGKVLSGFVKKMNRMVSIYKIENAEDLENVVLKIKETDEI